MTFTLFPDPWRMWEFFEFDLAPNLDPLWMLETDRVFIRAEARMKSYRMMPDCSHWHSEGSRPQASPRFIGLAEPPAGVSRVSSQAQLPAS